MPTSPRLALAAPRPWLWMLGALGVALLLLAAREKLRAQPAAPAAAAPLVVHGDRALPPFEFLEDGQPRGLTVDLWREISRVLGRPIEVRLMDWAAAQEAVRRGDGDLLPPVVRTPDRASFLLFTQPVYAVTFSLYTRAEDEQRVQRMPLDALRIGATAGGFPRRFFEGNHPRAVLVPVEDTADGIRRLLRGDFDALATSTLATRQVLREFRIAGVTEAERPFATLETAIGVSQRNPVLRDDVDRALAVLRRDGTLAALERRWAGAPPLTLTRREASLIAAAAVALTFSAVLLTAVLMARRRSRVLAAELETRRVLAAELQQARAAADSARAAAEEANRAKGRFLANLSHEIRTPMNAIVGLTRMLRRSPAGAEVDAERLRRVDAAAQHLVSLVGDVLDLEKIDAGKLVLDESEFSLGALLASVQSHIALAAEAKGLALRVLADEPPHLLIGDATRLRQALINFASNAVKFTDAGHVEIRGRVRAAAAGEAGADTLELEVEVLDTGPGVPAAFVPRLFGAFEQADVATGRQHGGTGLGLSIARRLAALMGGEASYAPRPGGGSAFRLTARVRRGLSALAPVPSAPGQRAVQQLRAAHAGTRVLVAEDNEVNLEVAAALVEEAGLVVVRARDGVEAVARADDPAIALVLMDMQMPRLDGLAAAQRIRLRHPAARLPIIAFTTNAFDEDRRACLEAGMDAFLSKPVDPDQLYDKLLRALERRAGARPVASLAAPPPPVRPASAAGDSAEATLAGLATVPGLDVARGLERCGGSLPLLIRSLRLFASITPEHRQRIEAHRRGRDGEALRAELHRMRGAAVSIGCEALAADAAEVERRLAAGASEGVEALIDRVQQQLAATSAAIDRGWPPEPPPG
jgi:signal transduction histidine kinase/DNA-binding NarL/FixJ family response regulator/HPt (histidine-containing phosphotransfer) domain-containing protein